MIAVFRSQTDLTSSFHMISKLKVQGIAQETDADEKCEGGSADDSAGEATDDKAPEAGDATVAMCIVLRNSDGI